MLVFIYRCMMGAKINKVITITKKNYIPKWKKKIKINVKAVYVARNSDFHSLVNLQQQKPQ